MGKDSKEHDKADERFKIEVVEHEPMEDIARSKYLKASEFCKKTSELFKDVYADYDGSRIEIDQQGHLSLALFFHHNEPKLVSGDPRTLAISRDVPEDTSMHDDLIRRIRTHDSIVKNGDRYFLTKDGSEGLSDFVFDSLRKKDGTINWKNALAETNMSQSNYFPGYNQVPDIDTKVSFIDPAKVAMAIYGQFDEDGNEWAYGVRIMSSLPSMTGSNFQADYMLAIERVRVSELMRLCNETGLFRNPTVDIIR